MAQQFEVVDNSFKEIIGKYPKLEKVADDMAFCEGTHWISDGNYLIWSDIPNDRIMRWSETDGVSIFRTPCGKTNGNTTDLEGRIISCETSGRRVTRTEKDGSVVTLIDRFRGKRLTSPNDVVVKSDGSVWFTDPSYGFLQPDVGHGNKPEQDRDRVYRLEPETGRLDSVCEEFDKPNGLTFSFDESVLYISDTGRTHGEFRPHHVMAFDVSGKTIINPSIFAEVNPYVPDGMRLDIAGNLYVTAGDGIQVFNPAGEILGKIHTPEAAANCSFGMTDNQSLFIAAGSSIWRISLNTAGAR